MAKTKKNIFMRNNNKIFFMVKQKFAKPRAHSQKNNPKTNLYLGHVLEESPGIFAEGLEFM